MSFFSVGKNEVISLLEREAQIKNELSSLEQNSKSGICNFKAIALNNEIKKIQNKIKILTFGNHSGGNDIA